MFGEVVDLDGEARGLLAEEVEVDADAGLLHAEEDGDEREVEDVVDVGERGVLVEGAFLWDGKCLDFFCGLASLRASLMLLVRCLLYPRRAFGGDGAAEFGLVGGDVVLGGRGFGELLGERWRRGGRRRRRLQEGAWGRWDFLWWAGAVSARLGGAGGDVDERVRAVRGVEEVALQHDVGDGAGEGDVVRLECAEDGFEVVNLLGELGVCEGFAEAGGVERDFDARAWG